MCASDRSDLEIHEATPGFSFGCASGCPDQAEGTRGFRIERDRGKRRLGLLQAGLACCALREIISRVGACSELSQRERTDQEFLGQSIPIEELELDDHGRIEQSAGRRRPNLGSPLAGLVDQCVDIASQATRVNSRKSPGACERFVAVNRLRRLDRAKLRSCHTVAGDDDDFPGFSGAQDGPAVVSELSLAHGAHDPYRTTRATAGSCAVSPSSRGRLSPSCRAGSGPPAASRASSRCCSRSGGCARA